MPVSRFKDYSLFRQVPYCERRTAEGPGKLSFVYTGCAVHAGSGENPLLWNRFGEVPHPISERRQDRLYRTLLVHGDGKKSVDLQETKPGGV